MEQCGALKSAAIDIFYTSNALKFASVYLDSDILFFVF